MGGVGWGGVGGGVQLCTVVLVFVTRRRAAVESGPELSRGGGEQGALVEGAAVSRSLLWSTPLFLRLTSLLLFPPPRKFLLRPTYGPERHWWLGGFREMRAAAAPWWHPGPCAL